MVACQKAPDYPLPLGQPLMPLGPYQVQFETEGPVTTYEIGVHWFKNPDHRYYKFCNFFNKKIDVLFILNDGVHIQIPTQVFKDQFDNFEIFEGSGTLTEDGFELDFWARDNNENISTKIIGVRP